MSITKGQMITDLKKAGIRKAEKEGTGATVQLEHLTFEQIAKLWSEKFN